MNTATIHPKDWEIYSQRWDEYMQLMSNGHILCWLYGSGLMNYYRAKGILNEYALFGHNENPEFLMHSRRVLSLWLWHVSGPKMIHFCACDMCATVELYRMANLLNEHVHSISGVSRVTAVSVQMYTNKWNENEI